MADKPKTLASAAGIPVGDNQKALTAGERGPLPIQDWQLSEKHAQFNRERDGVMRADGNYGGAVNYEPNRFSGPADRYDHRKGNDDYTQAGDLFRLLKPEKKNRLSQNIVERQAPTSTRRIRPAGRAWPKDWICLFRKCHSNATSTRGAFVILAPRVS